MQRFAKLALAPFYRLEINGVGRIPRKGSFILLPKHQRWQDIPLIALATPRPLYYIAKYELFVNRWIGWFLRSLGGIPLNREQPMKSRGSIRATMTLLKEGEGIVIFPEGTYYPNRMGVGKSGMLRLILSRAAFPLIPAGVHYQGRGLRTHVRISFGEAIWPEWGLPLEAVLDGAMKQIALLSGFAPPTIQSRFSLASGNPISNNN